MPMRINIGLSRKVGEANYGSRGASVNLDVELEGSAVREPTELQDKIRYLFRLAKDAVDEELNGQRSTQQEHNGNGQRKSNGRRATASQVRAIRAVADRQRIDLSRQLCDRFQVDQPEDLAIGQASELIDELKSKNGDGGRR